MTPALKTLLTSSQKGWLLEIQEMLEQQADVVDGSYGESRPNQAMQLLHDMELIGFAQEDA